MSILPILESKLFYAHSEICAAFARAMETMRQDADWQRQLKEAAKAQASSLLDHARAAANDLGGRIVSRG